MTCILLYRSLDVGKRAWVETSQKRSGRWSRPVLHGSINMSLPRLAVHSVWPFSLASRSPSEEQPARRVAIATWVEELVESLSTALLQACSRCVTGTCHHMHLQIRAQACRAMHGMVAWAHLQGSRRTPKVDWKPNEASASQSTHSKPLRAQNLKNVIVLFF